LEKVALTGVAEKVTLDSLGKGVQNTNFDQYKGVTSTYDESLYNVVYDESKLTEE
jgi:hypothetical protein